MQLIDLIEAYTYGTSKGLPRKKKNKHNKYKTIQKCLLWLNCKRQHKGTLSKLAKDAWPS